MDIAPRTDVDAATDAARKASSTTLPKIFPELYDNIIDNFHDDYKTLATCALVSRDWTPAARYHRFRTLLVKQGIDDHDKLGEALAGSSSLRNTIRTLWLHGAEDERTLPPDSPNMGPLTWLPVLDKAEELILTMTALDSSYGLDTYDYDLGPYLPSLRRLRFHFLRLGVVQLGMVLQSFPLVDTLVLSHLLRFIPFARPPQPPGSPLLAPPELLRELDLRWVPCSTVRRVSEWMLRHPRPENLQVLSLKIGFYAFGHAQCLLDKFGPLCLVDLNIEINIFVFEGVKRDVDTQMDPLLTRCTELRTLRIAITSYRESSAMEYAPRAVACANAALSSVASPGLETIVIEAQEYVDPDSTDILEQLDWGSLAKTLRKPTFARLSKVIIKGTHFSDDFLASLKEKCSELFSRELLSLVTTRVSTSPLWLKEAA